MKMFYFTDPMCSWCYGFSPVLKKLKENYPEIDLQIVSGGFSPGSTQTVTDDYRDFLEYHWRNVTARSGQPFDHSMKFVSDTFHYDTEPSSRALAVVQKLLPDWDFEFLSLMQTSFYVKGRDITNDVVLADIAAELGIEKQVFLEIFHSEEMKRRTVQGFDFSRQLGVQGFPTLLTLENASVKVVTRGFQSYDNMKIIIDGLFRKMTAPAPGQGHACTDDSCGC